MWVYNPERVQEALDRSEKRGHKVEFQKRLLAQSFTGKRLIKYLGEDLFRQIHWENISPKIGSKSSSHFPADYKHIKKIINKFKPQVIILFGNLAIQTFDRFPNFDSLDFPDDLCIFQLTHPAARSSDIPNELQTLKKQLENILDAT